jgi:hypothetical protein
MASILCGPKRTAAERKKRAEEELAGKKKLPSDEKKKLIEDTKRRTKFCWDYVTGVEQLTAIFTHKRFPMHPGTQSLFPDNDKRITRLEENSTIPAKPSPLVMRTSQKAHQFFTVSYQ